MTASSFPHLCTLKFLLPKIYFYSVWSNSLLSEFFVLIIGTFNSKFLYIFVFLLLHSFLSSDLHVGVYGRLRGRK